ncbi:immunoglobulin-like domain-containing protein [Pseudomonas sp. NGC7]|uniref:immunoglobulin-like domain-containing protein n=1 Tax=Pseudomonas sp. NGC7 TaxID=3341775 RepID=UPI00399CF5C9
MKSAADIDGRTFENLQLGDAASVKVTDTTDDVVAKLTATPSVTEGGAITYTITLTNKDGLPIDKHSALTFTLSDGTTSRARVLQVLATKATWSKSPLRLTKSRLPRTSNRPSPSTSTPPWLTIWS